MYTKLEDLKKWPKLFALACKYTELAGDYSLDQALKGPHMIELFYPSKTDERFEFWFAVMYGDFDKARAMIPDLFEEESGEALYTLRERLDAEEPGEQEEKTEYKHIEYGFESGKGFYTKVVDGEQEKTRNPKVITEEFKQGMQKIRDKFHAQKAERLNAAMLERDGPVDVKPEPEVKPNPHSEVKSLFEDTLPITKFSPGGM